MPNFFVCYEPPMGGIHIIFVSDTLESAQQFIVEEDKKGIEARDCEIYCKVE